MKPGPTNLITDIAGLAVGNAEDQKVRTGVTVILPETAATSAVDVRGGGPGTRETDVLDPANLVESVDAVVLSGGSVFGLDAASGVTAWLAERGRGFSLVADAPPTPIVPAAVLYDLNNGGDKAWGVVPPYRALAIAAAAGAGAAFELGNAGAGFGAVAGRLKGGLGSASLELSGGGMVGALVAVNAFGAVTMPGTNRFWAADLALSGELGEQPPGRNVAGADPLAGTKREGAEPRHNTTLGIVATDLSLTSAQAGRVAIMAQGGLARAIRPAHTPFDGDVIFVLSTGRSPLDEPASMSLAVLGAAAADVVGRAIARGVYEARTLGDARSYRDVPVSG